MSILPVTLPVGSHGDLIAVYIFALLTLVLHIIDTIIQYQWIQKRSKEYIATRVPFLIVILLGVVVSICVIETDRFERGTRWVPAIWVLLEFSILLGRSLQAIIFLRICNTLDKDNRSQNLMYIQLLPVVSIVLILDILAFVFVFTQPHSQTTVILLVLGSCFAHTSAFYLPLWLLGRAKLLLELGERKTFGLLVCSFSSLLAVGTSLGLFGFFKLFTKFLVQLIVVFVSAIPWIVLQCYKFKDGSVAEKTDASATSSERPGGDYTGPGEEYKLQANQNSQCMASGLSESGISCQHATTLSHAVPDHQEIAPAPAIYDVDSDLDSAIGGFDCRDSTTTLSSECGPIEKYGRQYHGYQNEKYLLPNDEQEQDRLTPILLLDHAIRVLDIGTGTGIWAIDFADEHPNAEVYGIDLSPIQPELVPPNCTFQIDDITLPWTFEFKFDFIHGRMLFCSFSDLLHLFRESFHALTVGGVLEMQDIILEFRSFDDSVKASALEEWAQELKEAFRSKGIDLACASQYRNYLEIVGFEDIKETYFQWPVGIWPTESKRKILGKLCNTNILEMLYAISIVPLTEHGMSVEAVQVLLARVRKDLSDPSIHAYLQVLVIHGRKPRQNRFQGLGD